MMEIIKPAAQALFRHHEPADRLGRGLHAQRV
jgi:hypothetical protein